jgi:hypothetical protein
MKQDLRWVALLLAVAGLGLSTIGYAAPDFHAKVVRIGDLPQVQVTVDPAGIVPEAGKERTVLIGVKGFSLRGEVVPGFTDGYALKLDGKGKPATASFPLLAGKDGVWPTNDYIRITVRDEALGLSCAEYVSMLKPKQALESYSVRVAGDFTNRTARLALNFARNKLGLAQAVALEWHLLDGEANHLTSRTLTVELPENEATDFEMDITPKRDTSFGPYNLTFTLNNEALGLNSFAGDLRFPFATTLAPVAGMEGDTLANWHIPAAKALPGCALDYLLPKTPLDPGRLPGTLYSFYQPFATPVFDTEVRHSGNRSLRIDYLPPAVTVIGSNLKLPGVPVVARVWVKGNGTRDRLMLEWRDPCNFNAAGYRRFMNTASMEICRLDFTEWRCFSVPVMGDGLPGRDSMAYMAGHSGQEVRHPIQMPVYLAALRVLPEPLSKEAATNVTLRSVWIDDLMLETQANRNERMTLELRSNTPGRTLDDNAQLLVTVGNGSGSELRGGRLTATFQDAVGATVCELTEPMEAASGEFTTKALALAKVAAGKPRGPVTAVVVVTGPVPGQRVQGKIVFARPTGGAVCWDFERLEHFNAPGKDLGPGADPVAGGADGTKYALPLDVVSNRLTGVMLHPALPGVVESVEMQVWGGEGAPVILQPIFADSGSRDFDMTYNQFAAPPVLVDWKGWKLCRFAAPAIPPNYTTGAGNPYYSPFYPLNLLLTARAADGTPANIRVDQIKVNTHLAPEDEWRCELDYPDETMLHLAGEPLRMVLANFSSNAVTSEIEYRLTSAAGLPVDGGVRKTSLPVGSRTYVPLCEKLREGFCHVRVEGLPGGRTLDADIQVPDRKKYFGDTPMTRLSDLNGLNTDLGFTERLFNLDWDTAEPVPNLYYQNWIRRFAAAKSENNVYTMIPMVGYAADWAGPEKQPALADGSYVRGTGNYMQSPARLADWDSFARSVAREHATEFNTWVFWQSPDMKESPVYLAPDKYANMFRVFSQWVSLYNTNACVVAGGFTFDRVLNYLADMPEPEKLPFNRFEVRVNPGGASVEALQLEDFLDDLDTKLHLTETGRKVALAELDWETGDSFSLLDQAAYHARAAILLQARNFLPHKFQITGPDEKRDAFGVVYRPRYGNSFTQPPRSFYVPKPAYFVRLELQKALADLELQQRVAIADRDALANRAYLFRQKSAGGVCAVLWRARGTRAFRLPAEWSEAKGTDAFGTPVALDKQMVLGGMPLFVRFPPAVTVERVTHELRNLQPQETGTNYTLALDFSPADPYSRQVAGYTVTGGDKVERVSGKVFGGERVPPAGFLRGVTEERFAFTLDKPGDLLLSRMWLMGTDARSVRVSLNGAPDLAWNLKPSPGVSSNDLQSVYVPGPRRSALALRGGRAGRNEVVLRHDGPGSSGGFRVTTLAGGAVDLSDCSPLAYRDAGVAAQLYHNAWGGALTIGKQGYATGIGCLGGTVLEYPLNKQYTRLEVIVGIDGAARGKGTVNFRILVDGKERTKSGLVTGMTLPKTLQVDKLDEADRLMLIVDDSGDGLDNDLANWVVPTLFLKETPR